MKIKFLILIVLLSGCASKAPVSAKKEKPAMIDGKPVIVVLDHNYFKIYYNTQRRLAEYVTYELTAEHLKNKDAQRANKFVVDHKLMAQNIPFVAPSEYTKSGYDRGHLAPSGDFAWDQNANDATFVMSNMVPQTPNLNRDSWKRLEDQVRRWACGEEKITVVTGPVLSEHLPRMKSGLEIPQKFFKIIIDETPPKKSISFVYSQDDRGNMLAKNKVQLSEVESITGLAFNYAFPDLANDKVRVPASSNEWKESDCER